MMTRSRAIAALAVAAALCAGTVRGQGSVPAADMAAINTTLASAMDAYARRDLAGVAALMTPDVRAFGSSYTANGLEEFRRKAAPVIAAIRGVRTVTKQDVTMSGNVAWVAFTTDTDRDAGTSVQTSRVRWSIVFERRNNQWRIAHFHLSTDPDR
jgi:uncharacterized protein (TIGR02246 family)